MPKYGAHREFFRSFSQGVRGRKNILWIFISIPPLTHWRGAWRVDVRFAGVPVRVALWGPHLPTTPLCPFSGNSLHTIPDLIAISSHPPCNCYPALF